MFSSRSMPYLEGHWSVTSSEKANDEPGGSPLYKLYSYVPPGMVYEPFWSENGYRF